MGEKKNIEKRIADVLKQIRPFLVEDGGDLELIELTTDYIARIELKGNCTHCDMNNMTFQRGIKDSILRAVPEVKDVEAVNFELKD